MITIAHNDLDLARQYQELNSGHFFDKDTMRFFRSKVANAYRRLSDTEALFITTEQFDALAPRKATVRKAKLVEYVRIPDGRTCFKIEISTVSEFNVLTLHKAKKLIHQI